MEPIIDLIWSAEEQVNTMTTNPGNDPEIGGGACCCATVEINLPMFIGKKYCG